MVTPGSIPKRKRPVLHRALPWVPYRKPNSVSARRRPKGAGGLGDHLSRISIARYLKRLFPMRLAPSGTRSCTDVRVLPLHSHVAMRFISRSLSRCLCLSARASLFAPLGVTLAGVTCYALPYGSDRSVPQGRCSDFPRLVLRSGAVVRYSECIISHFAVIDNDRILVKYMLQTNQTGI